MTQQYDTPIEERRASLERRANIIRSRLLRSIDALDVRRDQVKQIGKDAKRMVLPAVGAFLGVAVLVAGTTLAVRAALRRRRERRFGWRLEHAFDQLRPREERPSILEEVLRRAAVTLVSIVVAEVGRRSTKNLLDGRLPDGRPALLRRGEQPEVGKAMVTHVATPMAR